jgi:GTP-binding protein Era
MSSGNISIIGKPNVGKSTLFNLLIKRHLSGETNKPQTTRHKIDAVLHEDETEYLFVDTPGINFNIRKDFNRILNKNALSAIYEADIILHLVNYFDLDKDDIKVIENIKDIDSPKILVLNKTDLDKNKKKLPNILSKIPKDILDIYDEIIPISSKESDNIINLKKLIKNYIPKNNQINHNNIISNKPDEFFAAEYIREACIKYLSVELPYSLHVEINKFDKEDNIISIASTIYLKKKSHLSIVVGKNGSMLVKISKLARINSENLFNKKVYLKIFVKYDPKWKDSESFLNSYT